MSKPAMSGWSARNYAVLSIGAAFLTIALKFGAYLLTDSVGLLFDALESLVNLVAALVAWLLLQESECKSIRSGVR